MPKTQICASLDEADILRLDHLAQVAQRTRSAMVRLIVLEALRHVEMTAQTNDAAQVTFFQHTGEMQWK